VIELADQIELVDMSPQALQRRMIHGNVYPDPRKADLALRRFFTLENLTALRELALMRVANRVDAELIARWSKGSVPETRERILVCLAPGPLSDDLIRRGARMATRARGDLIAVHVRTGEERVDETWLARMESLARDLGGEFQVIDSDSTVDGVLGFAYRNHVTQCIVGEPLRSKWMELIRGSFINRLIRRAQNIDIHVIARKQR
jgi:two-component system sensor histidine kinase KdpD